MANPVEIEVEGQRVSSEYPMPVSPRDGNVNLDGQTRSAQTLTLFDGRILNAEEEAAAARDGYFRAGEAAREDLVAAGKWDQLPLAPCASAEVDCEITEAFIEAGLAPIKRRGRPPKVADGTEEGQRRARVLM